MPGRIELGREPAIYYTVNGRAIAVRDGIEYLTNNPDYEYSWVSESSSICVDNAVRVSEAFYIGRTVSGKNTFMGKVDIGRNELKYENLAGKELMTESYEVLVCRRKNCSNNNQRTEINNCEERMEGDKAKIQNLSGGKAAINEELKTCMDSLNDTRDKNELLIKMEEIEKIVKNLKKIEKACKPGGRFEGAAANSSCPDIVDDSEKDQQIADLKEENIELQKRIDEYKKANNNQKIVNLTSQLEIISEALAKSEQQRKDIEAFIEGSGEEGNSLCIGVAGCEKALKPIKVLTYDEQNRLMTAITDRLLEEDLEKIKT